MDTFEQQAQFCIDQGNDFAREFGEKMINLSNAGFPPSDKQVALLSKLFAETKDPSLRDKPQNPDGQYLGKIGQRLENVRLTLNGLKPINTQMGESVLHRFADAQGNEVVVFNDTALAEKGEQLVISGTVKAHREFRGSKSTTLARIEISAEALAQDAAQGYAPHPEPGTDAEPPF